MKKTKAQIAEETLGAKLNDAIKLCEILAFLYPRQKDGEYLTKMYKCGVSALNEFLYGTGLYIVINTTYYEKVGIVDSKTDALLFRIDGLTGKVIEE